MPGGPHDTPAPILAPYFEDRMVLTENSSTMNLLKDSEGNINIHEIKASTSGTKIVSNYMFNNNFSTLAGEQNILQNKYVDITAESHEEELSRMVTDMVEQNHTLQNHSAVGNVQQSIIQEQTQLLSSYNNIIVRPKDVQRQIMIKPIHKKETSDVNNTQHIHKSHLLPWISKEYTKLICPSKDSHVVTKKKKEHLNVTNHTHSTPILSQDVINKDISTVNYSCNKTISNSCNKLNINEKNTYLVDKTEETKELNQKCEVTITRIRGDHKSHLQYNKKIKRDVKDVHQENVIPQVSNSVTDALNLKYDNKLKTNFSLHTVQPLKIDKELPKLGNLSEVTMSNSDENIVLYPPIPIISPGDLTESKPSTSADNESREQMIMIQELQTMVPPNIDPKQSLKTFENGNVLLVAPLSANKSNRHRRLIRPKGFISNMKSDTNGQGEEVIIENSAAAYTHYTSLDGSMPILDENNEKYDDVRNKLPTKIKILDDSLLCDMRIGIEKKENLQYEDRIQGGEKKKRCRNGIKKEKKWQLDEELSDAEEEKKRMNAKKAKEHREKKKDEIHALKSENMQWQLKCRELEVENKQLKSQVEMLKSIFPMLNVNSIIGT